MRAIKFEQYVRQINDDAALGQDRDGHARREINTDRGSLAGAASG